MKLITKEIEKKFEKFSLGSQEGKMLNAKVIVKFFNPCGAGTWLATEGEKQPNGDWLFFGYVYIFEWECGYFTLSELKSIRLPFGLSIERDLYSSGCVSNFVKR